MQTRRMDQAAHYMTHDPVATGVGGTRDEHFLRHAASALGRENAALKKQFNNTVNGLYSDLTSKREELQTLRHIIGNPDSSYQSTVAATRVQNYMRHCFAQEQYYQSMLWDKTAAQGMGIHPAFNNDKKDSGTVSEREIMNDLDMLGESLKKTPNSKKVPGPIASAHNTCCIPSRSVVSLRDADSRLDLLRCVRRRGCFPACGTRRAGVLTVAGAPRARAAPR
jgi:hypothetical protein